MRGRLAWDRAGRKPLWTRLALRSWFAVGLCALLGGTAHAAPLDLTVRLSAPDTVWDSMSQEVSLAASLPDGWRLTLQGQDRTAPGLRYAGLSAASLAKTWQLSGVDRSASVLVGRSATNWSLWQGDSVVLSGRAPGSEQLAYTYHQGPVDFDKIIGRLSGGDRYLLAQRLTVRQGGFTGSVGEVAISDGAFASRLSTLLPWPSYLTQWVGLQSGTVDNDRINDNVFVQAQYRSSRGLLLGGEFFADDMPGTSHDRQPFQVAGLLRCEIPFQGDHRLALQYARVNNFTYGFQASDGRYSNYDYVLGWPAGPDSDDLQLIWTFPRTRFGLAGLGVSRQRHGEGTVADVWETAGYAATEDRQFLSGVVEESTTVFALATYALGDVSALRVRVGLGSVRNFRHVPGSNTLRPELSVELSHRFGQ